MYKMPRSFMVLCRRYRVRGEIIEVCKKNTKCTIYNFKSPSVNDN